MGSVSIKKIEGFAAIGGELPWLKPYAIKIVGVDIKETAENWFAFCPRAGEKLEPEWVDDIRRNGVREPVDVYRDGDTVVMLEGRRRVTAARIVWDEQEKAGVPEAQRITVRVNIRRSSNPMELFAVNVGSENRKERSPMQRTALMLHAQKFGADDETLAQMFSCTVMTVRNMLKLADLAAPLKKAVDDRVLPIREAIKLVELPREDQKKAFAALVAVDATHGARAANGIAAVKRGEVEKVGRDKSRVRSRTFLMRWRDILSKSKDNRDLVDLLTFVLGGPPPSCLSEELKATLVEAGFKGKEKKVKAVKE